ncbi:MAG: ChaN family lipoprotein [Bacteroidales bacterium]
MKKFVWITVGFFLLVSFKQDKQAYQLFDIKGKKTQYKDLLKEARKADIIFFGELHNNPICHWLQRELTRDLAKLESRKLILGAEMFETDNQLLLDEYISGTISERSFETQARLWPNYETDYKPLVEIARKNGLPFIATNIPRRYASVVHKKGFEGLDSLSAEAKSLIPPLPVEYDPELKGYQEMLNMMGGHASPNLPKAQAIKDAAMAYQILQHMDEHSLFLHFNGTYHSNNFEGIAWYVKRDQPGLQMLTIASVEQKDIDELDDENQSLADFILCVPETMTKTH